MTGRRGSPTCRRRGTAILSDVNISRLPRKTTRRAQRRREGKRPVEVPIKDGAGNLLDGAIPKVVIVKDGTYDS